MGPTGKNFALKMLDLLSSKEKINVINDQIGSPTTTNTLLKHVGKLLILIQRKIATSDSSLR